MCEFCNWLHDVIDSEKFDVISNLEPNKLRTYHTIDYIRSTGYDSGFLHGSINIVNNELKLYGDDYDELMVKANFCPECGASLQWAKDKILEKAKESVPEEYRSDNYILNLISKNLCNWAYFNRVDIEPIDLTEDINGYKIGDYTIMIDRTGRFLVSDADNKEVYDGYDMCKVVEIVK